ncbi:MAG: PepSY domain-containing protein [Bellilinea sp.]|jgi:uncharacterized membrane protein YkoI
MKINRFFALAAIALLVVGAMGAISLKAFAQTANPPAAQTQDIEDPATGPDTDNVEEQVGEQVEDGLPDAAEAPGVEDAGPDEQMPSYTSSIAVDQAATEGMSEADESAALQSKATISAADAEAAALAANPDATVVKTELDNENGALVYSVELSNGADVKVDAGNGSILFTDSDADSEQ